MHSDKSKVLQEVLFKPMIDWVTDAAEGAGIGEICVVTGNRHEQVEEHLRGRFRLARQEQTLGTAHAVMQAEGFLRESGARDVVVLYGDAPFVSAQRLREAYEEHRGAGNAVTVLTAEAEDPFGYGRVVRDWQGYVERIVEEKDAAPEEKEIREINSGIYWFDAEELLGVLGQIGNKNAKGEYYLTDAVELLHRRGLKSGTVKCAMAEVAGANDRKQLMELNATARRRELDRLYEQGVSLMDESGVIVGPDVVVGQDTLLLPGTILKGRTVIGAHCVIGPNSIVSDSVFGDRVVFNASQAYQATLGGEVTVGPFSHLRPNSNLHDRVHVGDFVEVKNSEIGEATKVAHLTYVGDSDVGCRVNFGCGVVTVNYDGVDKHRTKIGDDAFIGCNTNLVAPVEVGERAYTAAGSTITKNVNAEALAVARARQSDIEGWVTRKRPRKDKK